MADEKMNQQTQNTLNQIIASGSPIEAQLAAMLLDIYQHAAIAERVDKTIAQLKKEHGDQLAAIRGRLDRANLR